MIDTTKNIQLFLGDNQKILKQIPDNSIDSFVSDPPYELGFMGKIWDNTGIAYNISLWKEVLRVLKPGGHLLSFGGSRTYHRMACAIEDAGFEIRDQIMWVYGSGFPKSLNIGKAVDKAQGKEREVVGEKQHAKKDFKDNLYAQAEANKNNERVFGYGKEILTKGNSDWEGWGTTLKPAHEPIVVARKPLSEKTVVENVLKWGVGGINIDDCRIPYSKNNPPIPQLAQGKTEIKTDKKMYGRNSFNESKTKSIIGGDLSGRFPANLIHDGSEEVLKIFPNSKAGKNKGEGSKSGGIWSKSTGKPAGQEYGDNGSAARFFYCAKVSKSERNAGCDELEEKEEVYPGANSFNEKGDRIRKDGSIIPSLKSKNNHPTVKPIALMKYLITLISREGQNVLDPFMGSGTAGVACKLLNRRFIGIEISEEYLKIAQERIKNTIKT
ncbi:MAG: site-specific DNA-methyltransferase [Patescibacteria group bacterium]